MRPIKHISKLAALAGLALAPSALALPYDALQTIPGGYNVSFLGNLGSPPAPFGKTDNQGTVGDSPSATYITASSQFDDPSYWTAARTNGDTATPATTLDMFGSSTDITNASTDLSAVSGAINASATGGVINITLSKNGLNVIDLNVPDGAAITSINIANANGITPTGLIINVDGDNLNFGGSSLSLGSLSNSSVLFNFGDATAISLRNLAFEGALLAPLATVNFSSGNIDSALIAKPHYGPGQVAYVGFNDPLPVYAASLSGSASGTVVATPEPASIFLFGSGLLMLVLYLRRRLMAGVTFA